MERGMSRKRLSIIAAIAIALYILPYVAASVFGYYAVAATGQYRFSWGFSVPDADVWYPRLAWGYWRQGFEGKWEWMPNDLPSLFYAPLMQLDQRFWHPTKYWDWDAILKKEQGTTSRPTTAPEE
jgi:hypothetical protein